MESPPKPEESLPLRKLSTEEVQDAQIGLLEWELEEREKSHAEKVEELQSTNGIDDLTGVARRWVFDEELERSLQMIRGEMKEQRAGAEPLKVVSLIFLDVDHFKRVNDELGHHAGDLVLKEVAAVLKHSVRDVDTVARWGGEEFAILLHGVDLQAAAQKAEELRAKIEGLRFERHPELKVTASFGVASSSTSEDAETLGRAADEALLQQAKKKGRNRVEIYEPVPAKDQ